MSLFLETDSPTVKQNWNPDDSYLCRFPHTETTVEQSLTVVENYNCIFYGVHWPAILAEKKPHKMNV